MSKLRKITSQEANKHRDEINKLFCLLAKEDASLNNAFATDKDAILRVFGNTKECTKTNILVRLTLIDSMYSTQMNRRYYALDELAEALLAVSEGKAGILRHKFLKFAKSPEYEISLFDYDVFEYDSLGKQVCRNTNLFSENYGIGKDGTDKGVAISLISKYAYFETDLQFPIYDSIACEMYPLVWKCCGFRKPRPKLQIKDEKGRIDGAETMVTYVQAINSLIESLDITREKKRYDLLDRFLWFVGKIIRGNLSLVLTKDEYQETTILYPPKEIKKTSKDGKVKTTIKYFDIAEVDISQLEFLKTKKILRTFFEFAQYYSIIA